MKHSTKAALIALVAAAPRVAATQAPAVLENDSLRVEVIGLHRWTISMMQDTLARYAPKSTLLTHACAGVIHDVLQFPDAVASYYPAPTTGTKLSIVVTVLEPQDSRFVSYRNDFGAPQPDRPEWAPIASAWREHNDALQMALQVPGLLQSDSTPSAVWLPYVADILPMRVEVRRLADSAGIERAIRTLDTDGNAINRLAAVVLLTNATQKPETWIALVDALRDVDLAVRETAEQALRGLTAYAALHSSPAVDWSSSETSLRFLLNGTNLSAHSALLKALTQTRLDSALGKRLLRAGTGIVVAKAVSNAPTERAAARALLVHLAGRDLGDSAERWNEWLGEPQR